MRDISKRAAMPSKLKRGKEHMFEKLRKSLLGLDKNSSISFCIESSNDDFIFRGFMNSCEIEMENESSIIIHSQNGNMMIINDIDDDKISYDADEEEYRIEYSSNYVYISL